MYAEREYAGRMGAREAISVGIPAELTVFVKKTYALLTFSLVVAAAACFAMIRLMPTAEITLKGGSKVTVSTFPEWGVWALWGGTVLFGFLGNRAKSGARQGEFSTGGLLALMAMVTCAGAMLGPTIAAYVGFGMTNTVIAAAVTTAVTFSALTAYVFITGKNFSFMGGFLGMAFLAFFIAWTLGGLLFKSADFQWWMAAVGTILMGGMILFHTSSIVRFFGPQNMVVPAVIALFIDIFNLFIMLLTLLSGRRRD